MNYPAAELQDIQRKIIFDEKPSFLKLFFLEISEQSFEEYYDSTITENNFVKLKWKHRVMFPFYNK